MQRSIVRRITIFPASLVVPISGTIGGVSGYLIKIGLLDANTDVSFHFSTLIGSILLSLVFVLATARKADKNQSIIIEDAIGGFIVGAIAGLFSEQAIRMLSAISK